MTYSQDQRKNEEHGKEIKEKLKILLEPIRKLCEEEGLQSAWIPFNDFLEPEFHVKMGALAPEIREILREYGSIYIKVK